ncbi:response regulator [Dyadobacter aurulentus]|uniref:response regulator n=1 Tax=Dyadobacter sp. UC 10 TaxID=2605428 RepID=UPI0011F2C45E|nr:response regulator [Dyadobacter sp. UC 10]KAA0992596.1 response regulator [Dyadobacter sp. UC 10]
MTHFKLIIVENDDDERFFMKEEFQAFGAFEILGDFINGDTLLEWMKEHPVDLPDIVLSDLNMPGKNGYDILSFIRSEPEYAHIRVVITSTSSVISVREKCLAMGATDYLIKPEIFVDYGAYVKEFYQKMERS